ILRPFVSVCAASAALGRDSDFIVHAFQSGRLVAVDIARPGARARCPRILTRSVAAFARGTVYYPEDLRAELDSLFPQPPSLYHRVTLTVIRRIINCESTHAVKLFLEGCFGPGSIPAVRSGPTSSVKVARAAVIAWMVAREIR